MVRILCLLRDQAVGLPIIIKRRSSILLSSCRSELGKTIEAKECWEIGLIIISETGSRTGFSFLSEPNRFYSE